jgi:hypothetical protein
VLDSVINHAAGHPAAPTRLPPCNRRPFLYGDAPPSQAVLAKVDHVRRRSGLTGTVTIGHKVDICLTLCLLCASGALLNTLQIEVVCYSLKSYIFFSLLFIFHLVLYIVNKEYNILQPT